MADYVEKWGDDIDSAVELALKELKLTRDEVTITVLEQPSKGFLGLFKNKLAKVRVEKKPKSEEAAQKPQTENISSDSADETEVKEAVSSNVSADPEISDSEDDENKEHVEEINEEKQTLSKNAKGPKRYPKSSPMHTKFTITEDDKDAVLAQDEPAVKFIENIAENMGLTVKVKAHIMDDTLYIELEGNDVGTMIGKRGHTLDAVQYLASIVQNKNSESHIRVIINAEKYREKREKTLQELAKRLATKCIKTGKYVRLEPMNPYERKVIHSALQNNPKVTTRSEGVEPNRRVIIELKRS